MGKSVTARRLAAALLLLVPLLTPLQGFGAGLGKLTVLSALGQPLSAEIEIVSLQAGEADSLSARFAPSEAYRQAGLDFNSALLGVRFAIDKRDGRPVVKLASNAPINEPFLNVLVELSWNAGRLVREYTFLLDPIEYKAPQPIAPAAAPAARMPATASSPRPVEARPIAAAPAAAPVGKGTYEVKKGDTLGKIASESMPAGVSLQQMLIALYRANPDAFISKNINRLRAGRILNVPDADAAAAVDQAEARRLVSEHAKEFRAYSSQLAGAVASAPADSAGTRQASAGKITAKTDEPSEDNKDQLKLSKADAAGKGARAKAARADNAASAQKALQESQSRVEELEKNIQDLQKLLALKNQSLAELEKKAGGKGSAAPVPTPAPAPKVDADASKAVQPAKPVAEVAKPAEMAKAPDAPKSPTDTVKAPEAPKASPPPPPKPKPKFAPPPPPPPPPSLLDEFLNPVAGGALVLVLLMLGGYGYWAWKKKKATQSRFQDSVMGASSADSLGAASVFSGAGASEVDTGTPVSEVSASDVNVAATDADEVDPIAEADVYMAYGRDTQAEEILKDALSKDPERLALHAKMAEIYAGRGDGQNLEQSMTKVKELTGGQGAEWDRMVAIARAADPTNGMYGGDVDATVMVRPAAQAAVAAPTLDFDLDSAASASAEAEASPAVQASDSSAPASVDFDLGSGDSPAGDEKTDFAPGGTIIMDTPPEVPSAPAGLDFDLGMGDTDKSTPPAEATPAAAAESSSGGLDFNLDLDSDSDRTVMMPAGAKPAEVDLSEISFDLGALDAAAPAGETDPRWQEIATKLDLAKAYEEMGDKDGARDLLNEVVKEGDEAQQTQAREMLAKLG